MRSAIGVEDGYGDPGEVDGDSFVRFHFWHISLLLAPAALVLYVLNTSGSMAGQFTFWLFGVSLLALIPLAQFNGDVLQR